MDYFDQELSIKIILTIVAFISYVFFVAVVNSALSRYGLIQKAIEHLHAMAMPDFEPDPVRSRQHGGDHACVFDASALDLDLANDSAVRAHHDQLLSSQPVQNED